MSLFCPRCENLLVESSFRLDNETHLYCFTCPYRIKLPKKAVQSFSVTPKTAEEPFGGAKAWENVDKTDETCPKCGNAQAYFKMMQLRSADEPATEFYKCTKQSCGHLWRKG
mmetsp:Transcript_3598/g.5902  ORF Transcript_3598/g.5902 Transcript_3598/m.5902 type:complete len:112 (-) Transcript_3598:8-343(-)